MQIIIVQADIEEAIRNFISSRLRVADGMQMSIELVATRGADGFKATIEIIPIPTTAEIPAPTPSPAPRVTFPAPRVVAPVAPEPVAAPVAATAVTLAPVPRTPAEVRAMLEAEAKEIDAITGVSEVMLTGDGSADDTAAVAAALDGPVAGTVEMPSASETSPPAETEEAKPASPARSLFKGLKRPNNAGGS